MDLAQPPTVKAAMSSLKLLSPDEFPLPVRRSRHETSPAALVLVSLRGWRHIKHVCSGFNTVKLTAPSSLPRTRAAPAEGTTDFPLSLQNTALYSVKILSLILILHVSHEMNLPS